MSKHDSAVCPAAAMHQNKARCTVHTAHNNKRHTNPTILTDIV